MKRVNLSEIIVPNTEIKNWVRNFGTDERKDYGLEYLIEATADRFSGIANREKYLLPLSVSYEEIKFKGLSRLKYLWRKGQKPWSIRSLDQLRKNADSPYYIDLLDPVSYDGKHLDIDGIPMSHPFLKSMAYLSACIICGGSVSGYGDGIIISPDQTRDVNLRRKLKGCIINASRKKGVYKYQLKRAYTDLLVLTGTRPGRLVNCDREEAELPYIKKMIKYVEDDVLSANDRTHALEVIARFVEGVLDHKVTVNKQGSKLIRLPRFKKKESSVCFTKMFKKAFDLTFPSIEYSLHSSKAEKVEGKTYFVSVLIIPKHITINNH